MRLSGQEYVDIYAQVAKDRAKAEKAEAEGRAASPTTRRRPTARGGPDAGHRPTRGLTGWASRRRSGGRSRCSAALGLALRVAVLRRAATTSTCHPVGGWVVLGRHGGLDGRRRRSSTPSRPAAGGRCSWLDLAVAVAAVVLAALARRPRPDRGRRADPAGRLGRGAGAGLRDPRRLAGRAGRRPWWSAAADLVHRGGAHRPTANNIVLLLLAGAVVGYAVDLARRGEAALGRALAVEAAAARAGAAGPRHPRRRAAGAGAGPAPRPRARRRGGRAGPAGRRAGGGAAGAGRAPRRRRSPARSTCARCSGVRLAGR